MRPNQLRICSSTVTAVVATSSGRKVSRQIGSTKRILAPPLGIPLGHPQSSAGCRPWRAAIAAAPARGGSPLERHAARRGEALRGLDRRIKMGDAAVSGVSWCQGLGTVRWEKLGGAGISRVNSPFSSNHRHTCARFSCWKRCWNWAMRASRIIPFPLLMLPAPFVQAQGDNGLRCVELVQGMGLRQV
jgi:hypothetical protein